MSCVFEPNAGTWVSTVGLVPVFGWPGYQRGSETRRLSREREVRAVAQTRARVRLGDGVRKRCETLRLSMAKLARMRF